MTGSDRADALEEQLADEPLDPSDFAVLNSLRAYYDESDPVPDGLVERIQFELTLDALHAEIASLTLLDLAGARGSVTESVRTITFTADSLTAMVTLTPREDGTVRIDGWAAPGSGIRVEIRLPDGPRETLADEDGRFVFDGLPSGLARLSLHVPRGEDEITILTPTIEL